MMPISKRKDGWYWGSKGPFKSKSKAEEVQQAAYASGYQGMQKATPYHGVGAELRRTAAGNDPYFGMTLEGLQQRLIQEAQKKKQQDHPEEKLTEEEVEAIRAQALATAEEAKTNQLQGLDFMRGEEGMPIKVLSMIKEGDGAGMGTVAVSSDPGVFTETYGARRKKVMNRKPASSSKSTKSGPEKLNDFLNNSIKSLDDETFLVELIQHVGEELRKAGEGPHGTYTPYNERPYQPAYPQELKRKNRNPNDEINRSPTTENTVPVSSGGGSLAQSKIPQETVLVPPGVDDARNMNRSVKRKRGQSSLPTGAYLTPGDESGMNFQAMQKMPTHGNATANTPKQFSTERPQEPYIERKPRIDPNSDIEQEEFTGNVEALKDEDKAKKGRPYENNKDSNNINSTRIEQYSVHGGSPLQLSSTPMPVGLDSLHRESDDGITEPDEENTEELKEKEKEEEIPTDKDIVHAEKSAVTKMVDWLNDL